MPHAGGLLHLILDSARVKQDITQAVYWYKKAAEKGDSDAQQVLETLGRK